jgi:hypothetical protein
MWFGLALADFAIQALQDHVAVQIAGPDAQIAALQGADANAPDAIRMRRMRRRKLGLRTVHVEISEEAIELLEKRGYDPRRDDASIGQAVTALRNAADWGRQRFGGADMAAEKPIGCSGVFCKSWSANVPSRFAKRAFSTVLPLSERPTHNGDRNRDKGDPN